jgi:hypothetical protein
MTGARVGSRADLRAAPHLDEVVRVLAGGAEGERISDPIFLDISRASGGMTINQGGRDEKQGPQGEVWGQ